MVLSTKMPFWKYARNMEVEDAVKKNIIDYCYIENNKVKLKDNHNYMYLPNSRSLGNNKSGMLFFHLYF
jgi:hypothetical protein